jgi:SpoVK/Ycf46/Vps4 family AAA+-type ATPase
LYDRTRQRLRQALAGQLPGDVDLESTLTAYAYWVCTTVSKRGADWEATLREYAGIALRRAADEGEAERREVPRSTTSWACRRFTPSRRRWGRS